MEIPRSALAGVPPPPPGGSGVLMMQLSVPPPPPAATQWKQNKYYSLDQQHQHHGSKPSELGLMDTSQVHSHQVNQARVTFTTFCVITNAV